LFQFMIFVVLVPLTIMLLGAFVNGLFELSHEEKEERKRIIREGIEGYLDRTFGYNTAKIFKSLLDSNGLLSYIVYLPHYEWFKTPRYQWFEVCTTNNGYNHTEINR
jgi:hypothetical protein